MTKLTDKEELTVEQKLERKKEWMERSLIKHFGIVQTNKLKRTNAWDLFDNDLFEQKNTALLQSISAVNVQLPIKASLVKALWKNIDEAKVDETTKRGMEHKLRGMVDNLKDHTAYEVIFEVAMGGMPFPINITKAQLMIEKMLTPPVEPIEEQSEEQQTND